MTDGVAPAVRRLLAALCAACLLAACAGPQPERSVQRLRLIGEQRIALKQAFEGTVVGGLSGIDYDRTAGNWVAVSDDRSDIGPARFYTLRLDYDLQSFRAAALSGVALLRQADGTTYPSKPQAARRGGEVPDFEAIRIDPLDGGAWYASEGDRALGTDPFVRHAARDGSYLAALPPAPMFKVSPVQEAGPRNNQSFEGIAFAPDGRSLWVGMEAPLYQDGPVASVAQGAFTRITRFDRGGAMLAQFAYALDPIPMAPAAGKLADNGLAEILLVDERRMLMLERSGSQSADGVFHYYIRIYEADFGAASDIRSMPSLAGAAFTPARKRLVLDFAAAGLGHVDNLEGMAWGPRLANGHDSLVLVSDDNFDATQVTQFLAFEVIPCKENKCDPH